MSLEYLPGNARIWTFVASRELNEEERKDLEMMLKDFVSSWKAHGNDLLAGFEINLNCIAVVGVDESHELPSGCSIDKAFRLLREFGDQKGLDFFNRLLIVKKQNEK